MKAMLPAAVFALVVGLILGAVIGCNKENDEKKLGDVTPWVYFIKIYNTRSNGNIFFPLNFDSV